MYKRVFIILVTLFTLSSSGYASVPTLTSDSKVSLLTCSPNDDAIYALFGHSGLRVKDDSLGIDVVFDYGIFDFSSNNFIYRFVKGETDYMVKGRHLRNFIIEYQFREMGITEQILNLTLKERQRILEALDTNVQPENSTYRYNFFYDNCSTRPRDIINSNLDGTIEFTPTAKEQTYRDLTDECLVLTPWSRFGINLVIGSGADKIITDRQKDFLPEYLFNAFETAQIRDSIGTTRNLVLSTMQLLTPDGGSLALQQAKATGTKASNQPLYVGILLLIISLAMSLIQLKGSRKRIITTIFDITLFLVIGLAGVVIFFLMFFSEHPCVDANWNLVWLNPLPLLFIPFFFAKSRTKYVISYHFVNFVALTLFLAGFVFIPQVLETAFIPYILAIWLRSGCNVLDYRQRAK